MGLIRTGIAENTHRPRALPPRAQVRPRRPEHPDDHRRHAGQRLPDPAADPGALPEIRAQAGVFLRLYAGAWRTRCCPPWTPSRRLLREHRLYQADWLLRFYGFDAAELLDEEHPELQPARRPQVQLGDQPHGAVPRGGEPRRPMRCCCGCRASASRAPSGSWPARRTSTLDFRRAQAHRRGAETGAVFPALLGEDGGGSRRSPPTRCCARSSPSGTTSGRGCRRRRPSSFRSLTAIQAGRTWCSA